NSTPSADQNTSCVPSEASRKSHSNVAGKPSGTSSTGGSSSHAATTGTRKAVTAAVQRRHGSGPARRAVPTATAVAASPTSTITRYSRVRSSIVSGSPTAGGFAGYLTNGTRTIARNAVPAATIASRPSLRGPTRPRSPAYTSAKIPPTA